MRQLFGDDYPIITHTTPAGGNVFADLGFPPDEAARLLAETDQQIDEKKGLPLAQQWITENAKAFECWNKYVEKNGLPLAKYTQLFSGKKKQMNTEIPDHERGLHTHELKAKLARADAWMETYPPTETDVDALEKEALQHAAERLAAVSKTHYLQIEIWLNYEYVPRGFLKRLIDEVGRGIGWTRAQCDSLVFTLTCGEPADAMELLQTFQAEFPWFIKALDNAWVTEVVSSYRLEPLLKGEEDDETL